MARLIPAPHLRVPFSIVGRHAAVVEDGSLEEVAQNVRVILGTYRGERLVVPTFGIGDPTFGPAGRTPSEAEVDAAVERWEPRAILELEHGEPGDDGEAEVTVRVGMTVEG